MVEGCANGEDALQAIRKHSPDVASLDLRMPGMSGLAVAQALQAEGHPTKIVLLTADIDEPVMMEILKAGVQGLLLKEMAPRLLVQCIRKVYEGEQWIERNVAQRALEKMIKRESDAKAVLQLTPRERDLVRMISQGKRNKDIAEALCISVGTVKTHLHNIYDKLGIDGRMPLMRYARDNGIC